MRSANWNFVPLSPSDYERRSQQTGVPMDVLDKNRGIWVVDMERGRKEEDLTGDEKESFGLQITEMLSKQIE